MARFLPWPMFLWLLLVPSLGVAHSGGLDKYGCHDNRAAGDYHCHRGVLAGRHFSSQNAMLAALAAELGVGSIVPHHIPGFSGGAKIVQPGITGACTTGATSIEPPKRYWFFAS
jgi:hypothetical protein